MDEESIRKKTSMQGGTMVAFATCSCDSNSRLLGCNCTGETLQNTLNLQNYSKLLTKAINGMWAM